MTCLVRHGVRVDLAHVLAAVLLLDLGDVQVEGGEEVARDGDAPVVRDDGVVDRLDRLRVGLHPSDLSCERSVGSCKYFTYFDGRFDLVRGHCINALARRRKCS